MSSIFNKNFLSITYKDKKSNYPKKFCKYVFSEFDKKSKILDVGCGNGDFTLEMLKLGFDVYGIDISEENNLRERFTKVDIQKETYPFSDGCFDIVFCKSVIEHMREPDFLFDEVYRILKPDGVFICLTPSWKHSYKEQFYINHTHVTPFTICSLKTLCELSGFDGKCSYFYQLPFLWKFKFLTPFIRLFALFPIPYRPFYDIRWPTSFNKFFRFSKEAMLLLRARKKNE